MRPELAGSSYTASALRRQQLIKARIDPDGWGAFQGTTVRRGSALFAGGLVNMLARVCMRHFVGSFCAG